MKNLNPAHAYLTELGFKVAEPQNGEQLKAQIQEAGAFATIIHKLMPLHPQLSFETAEKRALPLMCALMFGQGETSRPVTVETNENGTRNRWVRVREVTEPNNMIELSFHNTLNRYVLEVYGVKGTYTPEAFEDMYETLSHQ